MSRTGASTVVILAGRVLGFGDRDIDIADVPLESSLASLIDTESARTLLYSCMSVGNLFSPSLCAG